MPHIVQFLCGWFKGYLTPRSECIAEGLSVGCAVRTINGYRNHEQRGAHGAPYDSFKANS